MCIYYCQLTRLEAASKACVYGHDISITTSSKRRLHQWDIIPSLVLLYILGDGHGINRVCLNNCPRSLQSMVSGVRMFGLKFWDNSIYSPSFSLSYPPLLSSLFFAPFPHYLFVPSCLLAPPLLSSRPHHLGHYPGSSNHYHLPHWLLLCRPTQVPQKQVSFNC